MQMLADPSQRQLVVAGAAAVLGATKRFWETYHMYRMTENPSFLLTAFLDKDSARLDIYDTIKRSRFLTKMAIGISAAAGLEEAIRYSSPVANSYIAEGFADVASGTVGYLVGNFGIRLVASGIVKTIEGVSYVANKVKGKK